MDGNWRLWLRRLVRATDKVVAALIKYSQKDGQLIFSVRVVPRAARTEILGEHDGALKVRLAAPPVDGAANEALVRILAKAFNTPREAISIVAGKSSKLKRVGVRGVSSEALLALAKPGNSTGP